MDGVNMDAITEFMGAWRHAPFSWQSAHCGHMPAAWVERVTGRAVQMPEVDGQFAALRRVVRSGGFVRAISAAIGRDPLPCATEARIGDVVAWRSGVAARGAIGVCGVVVADGFAVVCTGMGAELRPVDGAAAAWRVCA
jgi:hypothetical protein